MFALAVLLVCAVSAFSQAPTPFTLTEVSRQFDDSGKLVSESRFLFAVNRGGSIVSVDLDPVVERTRQILDVANARNVLIDPKSRSAAITPRRVAPVFARGNCDQRSSPFEGETVTVDRSAGTIHGVPVERVSVESPDGDGFEMYLAPSLGCHSLKSVSRRKGLLLETMVVEDLRIGDPDPALFEVPSGYRLTIASLSGTHK